MANPAMRAAMAIIVRLPLVSQAAKGNPAAAKIEASETYRVRAKIIIQKPRMMSNAEGTRATRTPDDVAIPFPPLKRIQQLKLWPTIAENPATIPSHSRATGPEPGANQK